MKEIKIFITGGTLDCDKIENGIYHYSTSHVKDMMTQANLNKGNVVFIDEVIMLKDSLLLNDDDRDKILLHCQNETHEHIIITHGTDTMEITARVLGKNLSTLHNKTIVLLGAMIPYNQPTSDAMFNFGSACVSVQLLPSGIYAVMNGEIFLWNNFFKNKEKKIFERKS